jgi:hypothetical protein
MTLLAAIETGAGSVGSVAMTGGSVSDLVRPAPPSIAGSIRTETLRDLPRPSAARLPAAAQVLWLSLLQFGFVFGSGRSSLSESGSPSSTSKPTGLSPSGRSTAT